MKICFKCDEEKSVDMFYRHSGMAGGYLGKCKACTRADVTANRAANLDKIQAYDRARGQDPQRKAKSKANYRKRISTPEGRAAEWAGNKRRRNSIKRAAYSITWHAIERGQLIQQPCKKCDETKTDAHHEDYTKPLDVIWLCKPCHGKRHREINEERRQAL